ncbi:hypothetical protein AAVH_34869, partial [Aphelenchoides avenae]
EGGTQHTLTVERNGERELLLADSLSVAVGHFLMHVRNSYCDKVDLEHVELSSGFIDHFSHCAT